MEFGFGRWRRLREDHDLWNVSGASSSNSKNTNGPTRTIYSAVECLARILAKSPAHRQGETLTSEILPLLRTGLSSSMHSCATAISLGSQWQEPDLTHPFGRFGPHSNVDQVFDRLTDWRTLMYQQDSDISWRLWTRSTAAALIVFTSCETTTNPLLRIPTRLDRVRERAQLHEGGSSLSSAHAALTR